MGTPGPSGDGDVEGLTGRAGATPGWVWGVLHPPPPTALGGDFHPPIPFGNRPKTQKQALGSGWRSRCPSKPHRPGGGGAGAGLGRLRSPPSLWNLREGDSSIPAHPSPARGRRGPRWCRSAGSGVYSRLCVWERCLETAAPSWGCSSSLLLLPQFPPCPPPLLSPFWVHIWVRTSG